MRLLAGAILALALNRAVAGLWPQAHSGADIPSADEALQLQRPALWNKGRLSLTLEAAPGCYLYRDKLVVEAVQPARYALGAPMLPPGEAHRDEHFGEVRILRGSTRIEFTPASRQPPQRLRVRYQGCAENQVCYPPQTREIDVLAVER